MITQITLRKSRSRRERQPVVSKAVLNGDEGSNEDEEPDSDRVGPREHLDKRKEDERGAGFAVKD
ncbi:hypothetical protein [Longimicrobium terrae]|uniref:Uncharacterized protein n=1 Tax=Longimicrobium terrae TaxID=1639882 RepID=A0A841GU29_9BACT|nr:hypothetical protein [Longimicrobium terrae]MBB4634636.1 hypothetical protein [Longimicrobium terrae]MBB6068474.1 hypothetical protein [Longimicrobium terrae]NNC27667.1 hypothetical protein [Longimicrobium terrae]